MYHPIQWLEELDSTDVPLVGSKAALFGELINARVSIPYGFVITRHVFESYCQEHGIATLFASQSRHETDDKSVLSNLLATLPLDHHMMSAIAAAYHDLPKRALKYIHNKNTSSIHAFTGLYRLPEVEIQLSTDESLVRRSYPSVTIRGENALFHTVRAFWAEILRRYLLGPSSGSYEQMVAEAGSVLVRQVLHPQAQGVAFASSESKNTMTIQLTSLDHKTIGTTYNVFLPTLEITDEHKTNSSHSTLVSEEQVLDIAKVYRRIQELRYFPQQVSWIFSDGSLYIQHVEEHEVLSTPDKKLTTDPKTHILVRGRAVLPGIVIGPTHFVGPHPASPEKLGPKSGCIIIAKDPLSIGVDVLRMAGGLIIEEDFPSVKHLIERLPHTMPVIVGAMHACPVLARERSIRIDGTTGEIHRIDHHPASREKLGQKPKSHPNATGVYAWVEDLSELSRVKHLSVDGILLDSQALLRDLAADHATLLTKKDIYQSYIEKKVHKLARDIFPQPLILLYRPTVVSDWINGVSDEDRVILLDLEQQAISKVQKSGMSNLFTTIQDLDRPEWDVRNKGWLYIKTPAEALDLDRCNGISLSGIVVSIDDIYLLMHNLVGSPVPSRLPEYDKTTESFVRSLLHQAQERSIPVILLSQFLTFSQAILEDAVKYHARAIALPLSPHLPEAQHTLDVIQHRHG